MGCGADTEAKNIFENLIDGVSFAIPDIDLTDPKYEFPFDIASGIYTKIKPITITDYTTGALNGSGVFDKMMAAAKVHLIEEFEKNRITGAEYTKAYIALMDSVMSNALQFLVQKDSQYWANQLAQVQVFTGLSQMETAKLGVAIAQFQAENAKAEYAVTVMRLSTESSNYCIAKYNLENLMPKQLEQLTAQISLVQGQIELVDEQKEQARAQTMDTRSDGITAVTGVMGKQKDLYTQQITSYQRDAENKAAKLFTDAWITMKTIDEGLLPPAGFSNASIDTVLTAIKTNNDLD